MEKGKKIFVAMSGGVDSSTTAALLKKKGYDISGVFIKGWYPKSASWQIPCDWREDRRDAIKVAAKLNIPFYTFDFSKEYKKYIIDYMIKEYKAGRTPNPDIMCNKYIKFDLFLKKALEMGADKIATGHYVKIKNNKLFEAKDLNKDQSYFLWTLTQAQLKYCLFPIGNYLKEEVRQMAKKFKLLVFDKKDSQGLCFVGKFKMEDFLKNYIKPKSGIILDQNGKIVGKHKGVQYYTIGQRHGMGAHGQQPLYIIKKDLKKNVLIVAPESKQKDFSKKEVLIKKVNWISSKRPSTKEKYLARIRYRQSLQEAKLVIRNSKFIIQFKKPQKGVASGQSLVLYKQTLRQAQGKELLGGGIIC
ncbi:tRNA 2-thiouridine(34) synthase MnmA [Patescibacteria group bacterium]